MKKIIFLLTLLIHAIPAMADFSIGYLPVNRSMLQATTNPQRVIFGDIRLQTNSFVSNTNIELAPFVNLRRKQNLNIYLGPGISLNPFNNYAGSSAINGYFLTAGARIMPFTNKQIAFVFEISPYVNSDFNSGMIRTNLGVAYTFRK